MTKASVDFSLRSTMPAQSTTAETSATEPSVEKWPAEKWPAEKWPAEKWLEQLLKHFSVQQLDAISTQEIAAYLSSCLDETLTENEGRLNQAAAQQYTMPVDNLAAELKRRVMRLAGVRLDSAFLAMAPDVIDEAVVEAISLSVEGRELHGVRYQGEVYRQVDSFKICHRLQAYCLAQTLSEQHMHYLITRSAHRFVVWVNTQTLPKHQSRPLY